MKIDVKGAIIRDSDAWVYKFFDMPACSPKDIITALSKAKKGEKIDVYINSGGGDVFAGSEIYSALREYSGEINIHVVGLAASAASVIACAGKSDISPTAMLMVHNVSGVAAGDYHDMDKESDILKKANDAIAAAYTEKTGMSKSDALALMDKETWLTAEDAVESGLIDAVSESKNYQLVAGLSSGLIPRTVIDKMTAERADSNILKNTKSQLNFLKMKGANL